MTFLELVIDVVTKADKAIGELTRVEKKFDQTTVSANRFDRTMLGIGDSAIRLGDRVSLLGARMTKLSAISAVAFTAGAFGLKKAGDEASNLEESINAVNVVFENGADKILGFAENSAKSVGLAKSEYNQLATETGALLKRTGAPLEEVAELTNQAAVRAADLASVFNTDVSQALSAINQAIRGETEAIRKYAGDVTDASLANFLLSEGINKNVKDLTQEEKTLFRLKLLMEQTASVQGDFARTIDSSANAQRVANAQWKNTQAILGKKVLPLMESVNGILIKVLDKFNNLPKPVQDAISSFLVLGVALSGLLALLSPVLRVVGSLIRGFGKFAKVIGILGAVSKGTKLTRFLSFFRKNKGLIKTIRFLSKAFKVLRVAMLALASTAGAVVAAIIAIGLVAEDLWTFFKGGESVTGQLIEKFKEFDVLGRVSDWFDNLKRRARTALNGIWQSFAETFPKSAQAIRVLISNFNNLANNIANVGGTVIAAALSKLSGWFETFRDTAMSVINAVRDAWNNMANAVANSAVFKALGTAKEAVSDAIDVGIDKVSAAGAALKDGAINGIDNLLSSGINLASAPVAAASNLSNSVTFGDININVGENGSTSNGHQLADDFVERLNQRSTNITHATAGSATN